MYYGAIVIDLMLRCTWSFKLSPHLDHFNDLEGGIFVMEFLEVLRRWMWIFFRVETEWGQYTILALCELAMIANYLHSPNESRTSPRRLPTRRSGSESGWHPR